MDAGYEPVSQTDLEDAHKHSIFHHDEIMSSKVCGCFYCLEIFSPDAIQEWVDGENPRGETALCPHCDIDAVIGDQSGYPISAVFLKQMHDRWFGSA